MKPLGKRFLPTVDNPKDVRFAYSLLSPTVLVIAVLLGYPLIYAFIQSFQEVTVYDPEGTFIGLEHYITAFSDEHFLASLGRSFIFVFFSIAISFISGLVLALLLNRPIPYRNALRAAMLLPFIVSEVSVGVIWQWMFSPQLGVVNHILYQIGLPGVRWLSSEGGAMVSIIIANSWRLMPFPALILLAGLQSIDNQFYEAAEIAGASALQRFRYVTLPLIRPMMLVSLVYLSFASFNQFSVIFSLTGGGPGRASEVLALHMYRSAFNNYNWGYGSALAIILFVINVVLSVAYTKGFERKD